MRSRTFLHVSLGILALALAYHFGTTTATAQSSNVAVGLWGTGTGALFGLSESGDLYYTNSQSGYGAWEWRGNMFGSATPIGQESFGSLKARYRGEREPQGVKPSTNR